MGKQSKRAGALGLGSGRVSGKNKEYRQFNNWWNELMDMIQLGDDATGDTQALEMRAEMNSRRTFHEKKEYAKSILTMIEKALEKEKKRRGIAT